jgi:hypothetical protein
MGKSIVIVIYILTMIATVVIVDILFFRHHFWERLIANIGIVVIYVVFYFALMKHR